MAFDSTANLLFAINADSGEAENNIKRFRGILSKDLSDMQAEFADWSKKVFGDLTTVQGVVTGGAAALGAAMVAVAGIALESANKYEEFVSTVAAGSKKTGIAVETMSALHFAAQATGTGYEELTHGITRFQAEVVKANASEEERVKLAQRLGVSTAAVAAGEKNIVPLLEATMDRFRGLASGTDRAALARELFSRNGVELLGFLRLGSEGLREMTAEAQRLGLVLTQEDVVAVKEHKAAVREMKEEAEAFAVAIGREVLPLVQAFTVSLIGLVQTVKQGGLTSGNFFAMWMANIDAAQTRITGLVRSMTAVGDQDLGPNAEKVKEAKDNWYGFSTILDQVRTKLAATQGDEAKLGQELAHLTNELQKAKEEYDKLAKEGKLTSESAQREAQKMMQLPAAIMALQNALWKQLSEKRREEMEKAHDDLLTRLTAQEEQTTAVQEAHWNDEVNKLRDQYEKKKLLTAENEKLIEQIRAAGLAKIQRAQIDSYQQELEQIQQFLAQVVTARMTSQQRVEFQYDQDVRKFSEAEEAKAMILARTEGERQAISANFAIARKALLDKYSLDLISLQNSQGWQGVFGARFGQLLQHDEAALREWQTSADQAFNMAGQAVAAFEGLGMKAFDNFAQGMGAGIAHAFIYSQSIGQAMRSALAATLESIAAEAAIQAIYAAALGFVRLAQYDYPAATAAFTAAAEFGAVAGTAMVLGRAIAPAQGGAGSGAGSAAAAAGTGGAAGTSGSGSTAPPAPTINVYVSGAVYGHINNLIDAVNDAVLEGNKTLTATNTTTDKVVYR